MSTPEVGDQILGWTWSVGMLSPEEDGERGADPGTVRCKVILGGLLLRKQAAPAAASALVGGRGKRSAKAGIEQPSPNEDSPSKEDRGKERPRSCLPKL